MANGNTVELIGNITRDPELRFTPSGAAMASFGLAVNRRWRNQQTNEWEEQASFFDVVCWRELAENASESLAKGTRVIVSGRLEQRSWETQEGDKRSKVEVDRRRDRPEPALGHGRSDEDRAPHRTDRWRGQLRRPRRPPQNRHRRAIQHDEEPF